MEINKEILNVLQNFEDRFEHEFRFGTFKNNKFSPGVSKDEFDRVLRFISSFAEFKGSTFSHTTCYSGNCRKRLTFAKNESPFFLVPFGTQSLSCEETVIKQKIKNIDLFDYNVRFSVSHEIVAGGDENCKEEEIFFKNMKRLTYEYGPFRVDFSLFNKSKVPDEGIFFDIEVELLSKVSESEVSHFVGNILKALQNQQFLVKISEKNQVIQAYKNLVKSNHYYGCQVVPLKSKLSGEYSVSLKLDGSRKLLFVKDNKIYSLDSKNNVVFTGNHKATLNGSVFDCELYHGKYYVFDTIFHCGKDLRQQGNYHLKKRLELVNSFAKFSNILAKEHHFTSENMSLSALSSKILDCKTFSSDGLIFTPVNTNYPLNSKDTAAIPFKWKNSEMTTIDFHIKKKKLNEEFDSWELYVIADNELVPFEVKDSPDIGIISVDKVVSNTYPDGSIVECMFDTTVNFFKPVRARSDKSKPNHITVALDNFGLILEPFELKSLEKGSRAETYFFDMRRFHNYIKRVLLDLYCVKNGKGGHLDLACGKGGDIFKWGDSSIRYVQGYDICPVSIAEANRRNEKFVEKPIYKNMDYNFSAKDLSKEVIQTDNIFDSVSCFFAIHYFFKDQDSLYTLLKNTKQLKIGGHFILSCFCSDRLKESDYSVTNSKFKIEKAGSMDASSKFGNKLNVFLQDTVLDTETTEYIVDYVYFIETVESLGFKLVETKLFEEYYKDWTKNNNKLNSLSKIFSFLNRSFVFLKTGESDFVVPKKASKFEFIDFCDTEGLEEANYYSSLQTKKIKELRLLAGEIGLAVDKKISKKSLVELLVSSKKF